jgi:septal ring factor EnvC (AmiA/AmiB activator)
MTRRPAPARPIAFFHRRLGAVSLFTILAAVSLPAAGQERLETIEKAVQEDRAKAEQLQRKAEDLELEIQALRVESIAAARKAQDFETSLSEIETQLAALETQEAATIAALNTRRAQMGGTLAALQRIALQPAEALAVSPATPVDTVRSAMLLRVAIPAIERRATDLRRELGELASLRQEIAVQRNRLADTGQSLLDERERLSTLILRKSEARAATTAEQQAALERAERMATEANDLRDLLDRVAIESQAQAEREARAEAERLAQEQAARAAQETQVAAVPTIPAPPESQPDRPQTALARPANIRPFPETGASLVLPARGKVIVRYGQSRGDVGSAKGITIAARRGAQVVAPFDGKVVYAGNFRRYGQILIIEHDGRYHTLIAGFDRIDAVVGQWLLAGEPVGILGISETGTAELYLELRRAGQPINPLPWLATTGDKVKG